MMQPQWYIAPVRIQGVDLIAEHIGKLIAFVPDRGPPEVGILTDFALVQNRFATCLVKMGGHICEVNPHKLQWVKDDPPVEQPTPTAPKRTHKLSEWRLEIGG